MHVCDGACDGVCDGVCLHVQVGVQVHDYNSSRIRVGCTTVAAAAIAAGHMRRPVGISSRRDGRLRRRLSAYPAGPARWCTASSPREVVGRL
jgi:hypothetical protein